MGRFGACASGSAFPPPRGSVTPRGIWRLILPSRWRRRCRIVKWWLQLYARARLAAVPPNEQTTARTWLVFCGLYRGRHKNVLQVARIAVIRMRESTLCNGLYLSYAETREWGTPGGPLECERLFPALAFSTYWFLLQKHVLPFFSSFKIVSNMSLGRSSLVQPRGMLSIQLKSHIV